jgi:hypothetical protein
LPQSLVTTRLPFESLIPQTQDSDVYDTAPDYAYVSYISQQPFLDCSYAYADDEPLLYDAYNAALDS